jgi:DNA-binding IclR family transcriptional regulator
MSNAAATARAAAHAAGLGEADLDHLEAWLELLEKDGAEPSVRQLAYYCDLHRSTVGESLQRLADARVLTQDRKTGRYKLPRKRK